MPSVCVCSRAEDLFTFGDPKHLGDRSYPVCRPLLSRVLLLFNKTDAYVAAVSSRHSLRLHQHVVMFRRKSDSCFFYSSRTYREVNRLGFTKPSAFEKATLEDQE